MSELYIVYTYVTRILLRFCLFSFALFALVVAGAGAATVVSFCSCSGAAGVMFMFRPTGVRPSEVGDARAPGTDAAGDDVAELLGVLVLQTELVSSLGINCFLRESFTMLDPKLLR